MIAQQYNSTVVCLTVIKCNLPFASEWIRLQGRVWGGHAPSILPQWPPKICVKENGLTEVRKLSHAFSGFVVSLAPL